MEHHVMAKLRDEPFFASSLHLEEPGDKSTHGPPPNSNCPNSQENIVDSNYYESIVICNEIDVEHEMKKVKDEDESVFKMLSMSFYDKSQLNRPSKTHNPSPARFEELNISVIAKQNGSSSRGTKIRPKQPSQPNISQFKDTPSLSNTSKSKHIDLKKNKQKPIVSAKLFAGGPEKTETSTLLSQMNQQKLNLTGTFRQSAGTQQSIKTLKDLAKNNTITSNYIKTNKVASPRREGLAKNAASNDKLKNVDSSIILRSHSPYIPSNNMLYTTHTIIDDSCKLAMTFSPRDDQIKSKSKNKLDSDKPKTAKYTSSTKKLSLESARKPVNMKPETALKPSSPTDFALNRSTIITNIEAKRGKLSHGAYSSSSQSKETNNRQNKTLADNKARKLNETLSQPIKPFKVEIGRENKKSQPNLKNPTSRDSYSDKKSHKSSGPNLPTKVLVDNYYSGGSEKKLNVKATINYQAMSSKGTDTTGGKKPLKAADFSMIKSPEGEKSFHSKQTIDHLKIYLKSQLKASANKKQKGIDGGNHKQSDQSIRFKTFD